MTDYYVSFQILDNCKEISIFKLCFNTLPYPVDNSAICKAQLLRNPIVMPENCQLSIILAESYNFQELNTNVWLILLSKQ